MDQQRSPFFSIVLNTFNREELVCRAIDSVLDQSFTDFELIVVDDGSTDNTRARVASYRDARLRYLWQENQGLSHGRNNGAADGSGIWLTFLDDDDSVDPDWLASFAAVAGEDVGMIFAGHKRVHLSDGHISEHKPAPMGRLYGGIVGSPLAGSWAIRRVCFSASNGFWPELPTLVQSEFLLRAIPTCRINGLRTVTVQSTGFRYTVSPPSSRPTLTSELTIRAASMILERHPVAFGRDLAALSSWHAVIGVAASRNRDWKLARHHFLASIRAQPTKLKSWQRLAVSLSPIRRRVWRPL